MIYLGTLGRMIGIKCPSSQSLESEASYAFRHTLEGKRTAQTKPASRRTWSLQTSDATKPSEVAALMQFVHGAWGAGPFVFVSADAPVTNMFTPIGAASMPVSNASGNLSFLGPVQLPGVGWSPRSIVNANPSVDFAASREFIPIVPGVPVTAAAWVKGAGARVRLYFYDSAGTPVANTLSSVVGSASDFIRSHVTAIPPAGVVSARLLAYQTVALTQPSLTWTDKLLPYSDGQGCEAAVVHSVSRAVTLATVDGTYSNLSFTVSEVG